MFNKILVATDASAFCDAAVSTAIEIAHENNGTLYILHVLEADPEVKSGLATHLEVNDAIIHDDIDKQAVKRAIENQCHSAPGDLEDIEIRIAAGLPWVEIQKWAQASKADLIILGPHHRKQEAENRTEAGRAIGSTIEGVVMREHRPVMIVSRSIPGEKLKFQKVMVSIDFTRTCMHAFRFSVKLAREHGSKLFIFNMVPVPPQPEYSRAHYDADLAAAEKKLKAVCREIPAGMDFEYNAWGGVFPHLEIKKYAASREMDLIIMGSHTKEITGRWYVGSAVEGVSYASICPVVVVTDPKAILSMNH